MRSWDFTILKAFNSLAGRSHTVDVIVAAFTNYSPFLFGLLFALYFFGHRGKDARRMRRTVVLAGVSGVLGIALVALIGSVVYRARPFVALGPEQIHLLVPHPADSSFPSDHTTGSAAFAAGMWRAPGRSARWVFAVTALLVGASRLVAGVHWPSDVLGSMVLGALCAELVFRVARKREKS